MNDRTVASEPISADALALGEFEKSPETAEHAAHYLDEQLKLQHEHAERERNSDAREAALHDLHVENLKLQSQALRSQHRQLRSQRLHDILRAVYQGVLSLIAVAVLAVTVYAVVSAARDQSVVVHQFQMPPSFVAQGNNGTVVASAFLDRLQTLQGAARTSQAAPVLHDSWSNNIQLQVPTVHVSLGDIGRTLHSWLGHAIQINGNLVQQGNQIVLTVRGTGFAAETFSGAPTDLHALVNQAADYVYSRAEPYFFALYLEQNGRDTEVIALVQAAFPTASAEERPWLLIAWGNGLLSLNQYAAAADKFQEAIRLSPHSWSAYGNLQNVQMLLGEEEAAYQTGVRMEHLAKRGSWFSAPVLKIQYANVDLLRMDLPAVHEAMMDDEATHGGEGTTTTQDAPSDAEILARMHADAQSNLTLETAPGASSDHWVVAQTAYVQGLMALGRQNYPQAASALGTVDAMLNQYPALQGDFNTPPVCYLGLVEELAGYTDKADSAIAKGGHFVDCYRFKGDIADHRGDWTQAQQDYHAAVNLAPSLPQAYQSWGLALLRHGDYKDAIEKFQQANQRGPHWCDPLKYWGDALAAQGNYKQAIEKYAGASKYTPGWGALELAWGQALDKTGNHKEALTHYQSAKNNGESLTTAEQMTLTKLLM